MEELPLKLLASDFSSENNCNHVWIRGYSLAGIPPMESRQKLADGWLVLTGREVKFLPPAPGGLVSSAAGAPGLVGMALAQPQDEISSGMLLLVVCRCDDKDWETGHVLAQKDADQLAGIAAAMHGRVMVQHLLFENAFHVKEGTKSISGSFPSLQVGGKPLEPATLIDVDKRIEALEPRDRSRTRLSLHWFVRAIAESGVDAFLFYWIAIETLCLEDSNIAPLKAAVARATGLPTKRLAEKVPLGPVFGLRGKIVHEGFVPNLDGQFLEWMASLYKDAFCDRIGLPPSKLCLKDVDYARVTLSKLA